jgi:hypothetical protein
MNIYSVSMPSHYGARKQVSLPPVTDNASTGKNQPGEAETSQVWQGAAPLKGNLAQKCKHSFIE